MGTAARRKDIWVPCIHSKDSHSIRSKNNGLRLRGIVLDLLFIQNMQPVKTEKCGAAFSRFPGAGERQRNRLQDENSCHIPPQSSWPERSCDPLIRTQRCSWPRPQTGDEGERGGGGSTQPVQWLHLGPIIYGPGQHRVCFLPRSFSFFILGFTVFVSV